MVLVPFTLLALLYFPLMKIASHHSTSVPEFHFNLPNLSLALDALFIPDRQIETLNPALTAIVLAILVIALGLLKFTSESSTRLRRTGVVILVVALLPVLVLKDFKLATNQDLIHLLSSPSHRIYFASIGLALMGGGLLRSLEILIKRYSLKGAPPVITLFLLGIICFNVIEVRARDVMWEAEGDAIHLRLLELRGHRKRIVEDGFVGLVNFGGSRGFLTPMIKVYFNLNNIIVEQVLHVGMTADREMLRRAERSSLFVLGNDLKVYDLSDQVINLLLTCRQASLNPSRAEYSKETNKITTQTNQKIDELLQQQ